MRSRLILFMIVTIGVTSGTQVLARAQSPQPSPSPSKSASDPADAGQEDTRGAFLTSRPKTAEKPASTSSGTTSTASHGSRRRPSTTTKPSSTGTTSTSGTTTAGTSSAKNEGDKSKKKAIVQKMGLGLTLFMRDSNGLAVRVDPAHEFHKGDRVRVLLETNSDGHLYIFNTTDNGPPVMIYPDPQLDEAGNYLRAHVPLEIPSSVAPEEALRWFRFNEQAGLERLFFVFTREPLSGVPIEDDLVKACGEDKTQCAWHPSAELWAALEKNLSSPTAIAKTQSDGSAQTASEHHAATRGIGLARDDPEPSLVMMSASTDAGLLVTALDLIHR